MRVLLQGKALHSPRCGWDAFPVPWESSWGKAALEPSFHLFFHLKRKVGPLLFSEAGAILKRFSVFTLVLHDRCSMECMRWAQMKSLWRDEVV